MPTIDVDQTARELKEVSNEKRAIEEQNAALVDEKQRLISALANAEQRANTIGQETRCVFLMHANVVQFGETSIDRAASCLPQPPRLLPPLAITYSLRPFHMSPASGCR
jgi:hypothetical protein